MKLEKLLNNIEYTLLKGSIDILVKDIAYDSRNVLKDYAFIAIVGNNVDGHDYIDSAIDKGASVIIVSKDVDVSSDVTVIKVDDTSKILSRLSMNLFDNPQKKMKTIAITGTKGKTTVSFMIKKILEVAGYRCGVIGTTGIYIGDKYYVSKNTTPLSYDTIKYMNEMVNDGIEYLVIEVSSQALKYDRVNDIMFDYGIFTNLTRDHISEFEHSDMDDYVNSKAKLFKQCINGIFNLDDEYFFSMVDMGESSINTYGYSDKADLRIEKMDLYRDGSKIGIDINLNGVIKDSFRVSTPGKFSSYNVMAAILTCQMMGIDVKYMKKALSDFSVKGRIEIFII